MRWLALAALCHASVARADDDTAWRPPDRPRLGARVGANFSNLYDNVPGDLADRTGVLVGAFALVPIAARFTLDAGLMYSQKGATTTDDRERLALDYVELPVTAVGLFGIGETARGHAFVGASLAVNVHASLDRGDGSTDRMRTTADLDVGFLGGAGLEMETGGGVFVIDLRIEVGVVDADSSDADIRNRVLSATLGFAY
jgi:hypothetical protein